MILCDTNILIEFFKDNQAIKTELQKLAWENWRSALSPPRKSTMAPGIKLNCQESKSDWPC